MQGLGNDYLYVFAPCVPDDVKQLSIKLSNRHFGAGSDGMIWILPSGTADFKMRIFNADGSEAAMCGNGIRCVGKYLYDKGYTDKRELKIETLSGVKTLLLNLSGGKVKTVTVDMGKVAVSKENELQINGTVYRYYPVNAGNPHAVIFTDNAETALLSNVGSAFEKSPVFTDGVNTEFVSLTGKNTLRMRVWERGSGITLACGTGACAAAAAAVKNGLCESNADISVLLDGGTLNVKILSCGTALMTGEACFVYEGDTDIYESQ